MVTSRVPAHLGVETFQLGELSELWLLFLKLWFQVTVLPSLSTIWSSCSSCLCSRSTELLVLGFIFFFVHQSKLRGPQMQLQHLPRQPNILRTFRTIPVNNFY